jgi:arylsulfatase A-like enzyme
MIPAVEDGFHKFHALPNNGVAYISIIGRSVIPPELLPETRITDQIVELIEKNAKQNFMITASWSPPHDLWVIPEPYYSLVDRDKIALTGTTDVPPWDRGPSWRLGQIMGPQGIREYAAIYYGMVKYIDDQVGRILQKLDELRLADNTLVIFTSDHGDMVGAHDCIGKSIQGFYDDLVRIPLLVRLPGRIKPGTVIHQPVSQIDLLPTILDYAGQRVPEGLHGRSLRPLLEGAAVAWRDHAFCQRADASRMLRTQRYKYCFGPKSKMAALYDLQNDPHEDDNLADDPAHAETVRQLHQRLLDVMRGDGDPLAERWAAAPSP